MPPLPECLSMLKVLTLSRVPPRVEWLLSEVPTYVTCLLLIYRFYQIIPCHPSFACTFVIVLLNFVFLYPLPSVEVTFSFPFFWFVLVVLAVPPDGFLSLRSTKAPLTAFEASSLLTSKGLSLTLEGALSLAVERSPLLTSKGLSFQSRSLTSFEGRPLTAFDKAPLTASKGLSLTVEMPR